MHGTSGVNSDNIHWETPKTGLLGAGPYSLASLRKEFNLTLDPCAPIEAKKDPKRACCRHYFTPEEDGLKQEWPENSFINPPFTPTVLPLWLIKSIQESMKYGTTNVALIPAYTDTPWWHELVLPYSKIRFILKRIKFWKNGKPFRGSPNIAFALAIYQFPKMEDLPWQKP